MLQGRRTRKAIAATLLILFVTNTFAPSISYALTSGPTQPEATSFEPVDTTDMVNLLTGSLTYNIPLIDVPGPEGGYPLALSYHAGIQPNEDASWVGLGWDLNAGAISRSVNGYPDEWFGVNNTTHVYWAGGTTSTFSIGVSLPVAGAAGVSFGLSFSQDTYQGFDVGFSEGVYFGLSRNSPLNVHAEVGFSPFGGPYGSVGIGASFGGKDGGLTGSLGLNFTSDFNGHNSLGFSAGVSYTTAHHGDASNPEAVTGHSSFSLLGASISTGTGKPSLSVGGLSAHVSSTSTPQIQTTSSGFDLGNLGLPISLGYNKTRYYIDQTSSVTTYGSLLNYGWWPNTDHSLPDNLAFDTYTLLESPDDKNMIDYPDPIVLQGGALDDYDRYSVVAQGLGGNIRPYRLIGQARGQNKQNSDGSYRVKYFDAVRPGPLATEDAWPEFRFEGDFSNSYRQSYLTYAANSLNNNALSSLVLPFDPAPLYGFHDSNGNSDGTYGYDTVMNILAGSRSVTTGVTIKPRNSLGFTPILGNASGVINGFTITNESGVKYSFGLPAYASQEEIYQEKVDRSGGLTFNRQKKNTAYAYTWYLTTITGPDYVDRNNDQIANDGDWGYWVNFEYGKWSGNYVWRTPSEGYSTDEDNGWKNCSMGYREVYYLNAIRTRSHVALFEKEVRQDGKGEAPAVFTQNSDQTYANPGLFNNTSASSMQLSHVYLLNAADENFVRTNSGTLNANVLDATDVNAVGRSNLEAKALRVLDFNYDYSLCLNTSNSFVNPGDLRGKLTLLSLVTRGKGGASFMPPNQFQYDLGSDVVAQAGVTLSPTNFVTSNGNFQVGDLIATNTYYCGVITAKSPPSGGNYTYTLANSSYTGAIITANVFTTKNPPYNKDFWDIWGMYKSDANMTLIGQNSNLYRKTTNVSSASVDAWSLRRIVSPLGSTIRIGYGSNTMHGSVINNDLPLTSSYFGLDQPASSQNTLVKFQVSASQADYTFYSPPQVGDHGLIAVQSTQVIQDDHNHTHRYSSTSKILTFTVTNVDSGMIHATLSGPINGIADEFNAILFFTNQLNYVGGGLRVNSISTQSDNTSQVYTTKYAYTMPGSNQSSGVTSYFPVGLDAVATNYRMSYLNLMSPVYALARELPPPGVMYEYVTVTQQIQNQDEPAARTLPGSTRYQYEVFKPNMVGRVEVAPRQTGTYLGQTQYARYYSIDKFTSCIGNVKRVTQLDDKGNKLSETINNYLHDGLMGEELQQFMTDYKNLLAQYNYQGYIQERFAEVKQVNNQDVVASNLNIPPDVSTKATITAREEFPCIQTGQTVINYVNGTQTSSQNLAFDFYSGAVTKTLETDEYGNKFRTENVPAYRVPQYASMGVKINNQYNPSSANANMLTQVAETRTYKVDGSNTPLGLVSASATTWSTGVPAMGTDGTIYTQNGTNGTVWRPQYTYLWMPTGQTSDGLTPIGSFPATADFNFATPASSDSRWVKASEVTLYDVYSKPLEIKDVNGNYAATRMNYKENKIMLSGGPANYYEIAYSGAEDSALNQTAAGFVQAADGTVATAAGAAHTGARSLLLGVSGKKGFLYSIATNKLTPGRTYRASVWVKPVSGTASDVKLYYDINGTIKANSVSSGSSTRTAAGWIQLNLTINGSDIVAGNTLNVWCRNDHASATAYVDDMRFQPLNASTSAYVYDSFSGELTYVLDNNNIYTRYQYDAGGRLMGNFKEKLGVGEYQIHEYLYNYSSPLYKSAAFSQSLAKNNCAVNQQGSIVPINIPAGAFNSYVSQFDADLRSRTYAQDLANSQGTCTPLVTITLTRSISVGTSNLQVAFIGGTTGIVSFPSTNSSITTNLLPGTYTMQFSGTYSGNSSNINYSLSPNNLIWSPMNVTTGSVTFSTGTSYIITVTDRPQ